MATREEVLAQLVDLDDEPAAVNVADLALLTGDDLPDGALVEPVDRVESGIVYLASNMRLGATDGHPYAEVEEIGWRKFWSSPLGIVEYFDLVQQSCRTREAVKGDVVVGSSHDQDVIYGFNYCIDLPDGDLRTAFLLAEQVRAEILEPVESTVVSIVDLVTRTERRLRGWGSDPLDSLVDRMRSGTPAEKGAILEELASRLFSAVPGFTATGHVITQTEEIDIRIHNASDHPLWKDEKFMLLAECKNWSTKCGKNEFVVFKEKLANRVGRVSCGFLISWNGFAETVTKEMLRGSHGDLLIVPITGADLRAAVREGDFDQRLQDLHFGGRLSLKGPTGACDDEGVPEARGLRRAAR